MVFCNVLSDNKTDLLSCHNPYFNRWFSAILTSDKKMNGLTVTILILIDGFLQCINFEDFEAKKDSHNPYFNRWFSAI